MRVMRSGCSILFVLCLTILFSLVFASAQNTSSSLPSLTFDGTAVTRAERLADENPVAARRRADPNPDEFLVEDGKLLMVAGDVAGLMSAMNTNIMGLDQKFPKKDWIMKATVSAEFATVKEDIWVCAMRDEKNFAAVRLYASGSSSFGWKLGLRVEKMSNGKRLHFEENVRRMP